jgi:hypothetical protein
MKKTKASKDERYRSSLEKRPKFVTAIGMISVENASLEVLLAELLAALLGIHGDLGILIYFTPRAAIPRLDTIANVLEPSIGGYPTIAAKVRGVIKRAKNAIGKRHAVVHALWTLSDDSYPTQVHQIFFPSWDGGEVKLTTLHRLIDDFRALIDEVGPLIDEVQMARGQGWKRPYNASLDKPVQPDCP